eukprot:1676478-Rhodomonas_salina.4
MMPLLLPGCPLSLSLSFKLPLPGYQEIAQVQLPTRTQVSLHQQEVYLSDSEAVIINTAPYEDVVAMLLQLQKMPNNDGQLSCDLNWLKNPLNMIAVPDANHHSSSVSVGINL